MKAKIGRQYVLQSSLSAARAFRSSPPAQARTTLQRVVENRSGECPPLAIASGITPAHRLIYAFVRQALNLPARMPANSFRARQSSLSFSGNVGMKFAENLRIF